MKTLGMDAEPEEIRKLLNDVDTDGDGTVSFDEFLVMMSNPPTREDTREDLTPRTDGPLGRPAGGWPDEVFRVRRPAAVVSAAADSAAPSVAADASSASTCSFPASQRLWLCSQPFIQLPPALLLEPQLPVVVLLLQPQPPVLLLLPQP